MLRNTLFLLILAGLSPLAQAEIYTWKDANGNIQFSDNPPPKGVKAQTVKPKPQSGPTPDEAEAPPADAPPQTGERRPPAPQPARNAGAEGQRPPANQPPPQQLPAEAPPFEVAPEEPSNYGPKPAEG